MDLDITRGYNLQDIHVYISLLAYIIFYRNFLAAGVTHSLIDIYDIYMIYISEILTYRTIL